jgi:UDP-N-acetylmuramate--alanine ligase
MTLDATSAATPPAATRQEAVSVNPGWHYHFLGIGGVGMSALAELLFRRGIRVSGSDSADSPTVRHLMGLGIPVAGGHTPAALGDADAVVYTPAVSPAHPIWSEIARRGLPRLHRAALLGAVTRGRPTLAVAGTHGKTTSTAALGFALVRAGWDPTVLVGGHVTQFGGRNFRPGAGEWCVVEADESDGSFIHLAPRGMLITNIDADHLDHHGTMENVAAAFQAFAAKLDPAGVLVYCADDPAAARLGNSSPARTLSYGESTGADVRVQVGPMRPGAMTVTLTRQGQPLTLTTRLVGRHNALNLAGVYTLAQAVGIPAASLTEAVSEFLGVDRRQQFIGTLGASGGAVFDDYAHHPTEIRATLEMFLAIYGQPLTVVFQPHLYSRTAHFADAFAEALRPATRIYVTEVYAAREQPLPGVSGKMIVERLAGHPAAQFVARWQDLVPRLAASEAPRNVLLTLGAGDITGLGPAVVQASARR